MADDLGFGYAPTLSPRHAVDAFDLSAYWIGSNSFTNALRERAVLLYPAGYQVPFAQEAASEWEQLSLAIHKLPTQSLQYSVLKRLLDICVVVSLLPFVLPLLLIVALIVKLSSPGPIFYRQTRVGRFGRQFSLWKFRSMQMNSEEILRKYFAAHPEAELEWIQTRKLRVDPRVTSLGRMLRRSSLDELPQFFNVLHGSMSLVGPRPIVKAERENYGDAYLFYASAKPGLSGLWQVSGRSNLSYEQRVALDAEYIGRWNLALDLKILCKTAAAVWGSRGAF